MHLSDQYYCVGCGKMEELDRAYLLFQTGFFRIVHPLGCCVQCSRDNAEQNPLSAPKESEAAEERHYSTPEKKTFTEEFHADRPYTESTRYAVMI